jgi:hypothetical protein
MFNPFKLFLAHGEDSSHVTIEWFELNDIAQCVQSIQLISCTWIKIDLPGYPITWDNSFCSIKDKVYHDFLLENRDAEVALGQFSPTFGPHLLPGMYSTPVSVIPKPHLDTLRMVVD